MVVAAAAEMALSHPAKARQLRRGSSPSIRTPVSDELLARRR